MPPSSNAISIEKQSCNECKTKKFMQRCLQSTWRELAVAYVEFLQTADCEISWNQLAFSETRNVNNFKLVKQFVSNFVGTLAEWFQAC